MDVTIQPMKSFGVSTSIHASPQIIWEILTDASKYTTWNSTISKIEGTIAPHQRLKVHVKIKPARAFPVMVTEFVVARKMVWTGGMPLGLFKGERTFTLTPIDGEVEFRMIEIYTGLLEPLIGRSIPDLQPAFDQFAVDLQKRAERVQ